MRQYILPFQLYNLVLHTFLFNAQNIWKKSNKQMCLLNVSQFPRKIFIHILEQSVFCIQGFCNVAFLYPYYRNKSYCIYFLSKFNHLKIFGTEVLKFIYLLYSEFMHCTMGPLLRLCTSNKSWNSNRFLKSTL